MASATVLLWMSARACRYESSGVAPSWRYGWMDGRNFDWRVERMRRGPGFTETTALEGWSGRRAPSRNCLQSMESSRSTGSTSASLWRWSSEVIRTAPEEMRRAAFWTAWRGWMVLGLVFGYHTAALYVIRGLIRALKVVRRVSLDWPQVTRLPGLAGC